MLSEERDNLIRLMSSSQTIDVAKSIDYGACFAIVRSKVHTALLSGEWKTSFLGKYEYVFVKDLRMDGSPLMIRRSKDKLYFSFIRALLSQRDTIVETTFDKSKDEDYVFDTFSWLCADHFLK